MSVYLHANAMCSECGWLISSIRYDGRMAYYHAQLDGSCPNEGKWFGVPVLFECEELKEVDDGKNL